jgi:hypothetical protein
MFEQDLAILVAVHDAVISDPGHAEKDEGFLEGSR